MRKKQQFVRPAVLRELTLLPDTPILQGSVVDNTTIVATGQEVKEWNYETDFDHNWEE